MMKKLILVIFCAVFIMQNLWAQNLNKAKLDSLFDALSNHQKSMISVAISKNGKLVYENAVGYRLINDQQKIPATADTRYRIGSITKMFTGTMIFQLIEAGKLSLDTKLDIYFPQIPNAAQITIAQMLSHHSGIHNFTVDSNYTLYHVKPQTEVQMLEKMRHFKPDFEPGSSFAYSNSNFLLLGYVLEKIYNKPYSEILKEKILVPAGLKNTYYGGKINLQDNEAYSYTFDNGTWKQESETDMSVPGGAGGIVATSADLDKFIYALFNGKLISKNSVQQMQTTTLRYGMAMFVIPFYEKKAYGHNGGIDGFESLLGYFPEDQVAFAACANGNNYDINAIMTGVLSIYYNRPYQIPDFKTISISEADFTNYTGIYSSKDIPSKIIIGRSGDQLTAQATGQAAFKLDQTSQNIFKFAAAGVEIDFDLQSHQFTLKQGKSYLFTKEN